jgi:hypothetical protein
VIEDHAHNAEMRMRFGSWPKAGTHDPGLAGALGRRLPVSMAMDRSPLAALPAVDMGYPKLLLGRRVAAERRHVALDGDCVGKVAADGGGDEFPLIVTYCGELGGNAVERLRHVPGPACAQSPGGEERYRIGSCPEGVVRGCVPIVKCALRVDEPRQEVVMEILEVGIGSLSRLALLGRNGLFSVPGATRASAAYSALGCQHRAAGCGTSACERGDLGQRLSQPGRPRLGPSCFAQLHHPE